MYVTSWMSSYGKEFKEYHTYQLSTRAGYDTRSIFKQSLIGLKSEFSFS